jgi:hypothetical protein
MKIIYLSIAGFNIEIKLKDTDKLHEEKTVINMLNTFYKGFILNKKIKKINYRINFLNQQRFFVLFRRNRLRFLLFFVEAKKKKIINTFYHISQPQFSLILIRILNNLLKNCGFIMHASASNVNGKVCIFVGRSGAGKSTIMKLLTKRYVPLADDSIIIKKEYNKFYFYQTPFLEKENWIKRDRQKYEVDKIYFLRKSKDIRAERIKDTNYIFKRLIKQFWSEQHTFTSQMKVFFEFVSRFREFYFLYFPKNETIIDYFKEIY